MADLTPLEVALRFVDDCAADPRVAGERWLAATCVQDELPNRLKPNGAHADAAMMRANAERGRGLLASQRYDVVASMVDGARVALELDWRGVLALPVAHLPAGAELRAHIAMFLDVVDGRITRIRNYDCYEPF